MLRSRVPLALVGAALAAMTSAASASVVINLDYEFSSGTAPSGPGPWMTFTFTQNGANNVQLTIASHLATNEFTSGVYFNVNTIDPSAVGIAFNSGLSVGSFSGTINPGSLDAYHADGDGYYDFKIDFDSSSGSSNTSRFNDSEVAVFDLSGAGLLESWFNQGSLSGPNGAFHAAAHVQGIGPSGGLSGWIGDGGALVPIPTSAGIGTLTLGGIALARIIARRRA